MAAPYGHARLKIERAEKHIADLQAAINALKDTCIVTIEKRENGGESLKHEISEFRDALDRLSLIVGDAVHNLRTAMDFAWQSTIERILPDKISDSTKFPVRRTRQEIEGALRGIEVDTRCKPLFNCIVSQIQPYSGSANSAVWTLHNLDISDKHLLLLGLDPVGHITGIAVRDANGELHRGSSMPAEGINGMYRIDFEYGLQVENKGQLSVAVTLQDAGIFKPVSVLSLLNIFKNFTLYTVKLLENVIC